MAPHCITWRQWPRPWAIRSYLSGCDTKPCQAHPYAMRGHKRCSKLQYSPPHTTTTAVPGPKPGRRESMHRVLRHALSTRCPTILDMTYDNLIAQEPRVGGSADQQPPVVHHMTTAHVPQKGTKHNGQATHLGFLDWTAEAEATGNPIPMLHGFGIHALYPLHTLIDDQSLFPSLSGPVLSLDALLCGDTILEPQNKAELCFRSAFLQGQAVTAPCWHAPSLACPLLMCRSYPLRCLQQTIPLIQIHSTESVLCSLGVNGSLYWPWLAAEGLLHSLDAPQLRATVQVSLMCPTSAILLNLIISLAQLEQGPHGGSDLHEIFGTPYPDHVQYLSTLASHARPSDMGRNGPSPSAKLKSSRRPPSRFRNPSQGGDNHVDTTSVPAKASPANQGDHWADNGWGTAWTWESSDTNWNSDWKAAHAANAGWWTGQWTAR